MYELFRRSKARVKSTALGSAASAKNSAQEKPPPVWARSHGSSLERGGCWHSPGRQKRELWTILSFPKGMGAPTRMAGTAQERTGMNGCSLSAFPPPLRWTPSRGQAPFLSPSPTEERQKPLDESPSGVSPYSVVLDIYPFSRIQLRRWALTLTNPMPKSFRA